MGQIHKEDTDFLFVHHCAFVFLRDFFFFFYKHGDVVDFLRTARSVKRELRGKYLFDCDIYVFKCLQPLLMLRYQERQIMSLWGIKDDNYCLNMETCLQETHCKLCVITFTIHCDEK